jgi:aldehyde dehydrogenase (NAD+)
MQETSEIQIKNILEGQRAYFRNGHTQSISFRIENLKKLKKAILDHETAICEALWEDLHKSKEEAYLTEISLVLGEIDYHIRHLKKWSKPQRKRTPLHLLPASSYEYYEPLGVALIVAPWNYPFQLVFNPLVGAISSGCCAIVKPSPFTNKTAQLMEAILNKIFPMEYIKAIQGSKETNEALLRHRFDFIFFTGSTHVGKVFMKGAAEFLTPIVLELGGKSPCIVDHNAQIDVAAKRIIWGKTINAGQTCIAPDYLFVHISKKEALIEKMKYYISEMYSDTVESSKYYPRIIHQDAFDRLADLMGEGKICIGGKMDRNTRFIEPTVIEALSLDAQIMQEEIFGPILPIFTFTNIEEVEEYILSKEKPLAMYYFGGDAGAERILRKISSGGAAINDTLIHIANHNLSFGGVGNSGMGSYHGKGSFLAFSHKKAVVKSPTWLDLPFKYAPFKYFEWVKNIL